MTISDLALVAALFLVVSLIGEMWMARRRWARLDAAQRDSTARLRIELTNKRAELALCREEYDAQREEIRRLQGEVNQAKMREAVTPPPDPTESTRLLLQEFGKIMVDVLHGPPRDTDDDEFPDAPSDPDAFTVVEEPEVEWMDLDDYDELEGAVGGITMPPGLTPEEIEVD